jgi:hypothetical protein
MKTAALFRVLAAVTAAAALAWIVYRFAPKSHAQHQAEPFWAATEAHTAPTTTPPQAPPEAPPQTQTTTVQPSEEQLNAIEVPREVDFATSGTADLNEDGCFPRDNLTASDLLPAEDAANSTWSQLNPAGQGDVGSQNFLSAGFHVGINTVSGTLRNANMSIRSEPPNPRGVWPIMNSTIEPDLMRRPLEIGATDD